MTSTFYLHLRCIPLLFLLIASMTEAAGTGTENQPSSGFSFAAFGDVPYSHVERERMLDMLAEQTAQPLEFSIHIGDIKSGGSTCDDATFADRRTLLDRSAHPLIVLPGDNEWTDCSRASAGSWAPHERLNALRSLFFADGESIGRRRITLERQQDFPENVRWRQGNVLFATLNVSGSVLPAGEQSAAVERATLDWLDEAFALAGRSDASALVIAFHANPGFEAHAGGKAKKRHRPLLDRLASGAAAYRRPVLLIHGDTHRFRVDQPLHDPVTGLRVENVTRLETHGSPWLGWTRVDVDPSAQPVFRFEPYPRLLP